MKKKVAIITGSSRGIGAETAKKLTESGFLVVINYHASKKKALALVKEIRKTNSQAIAIKADMCKIEDINYLIDQIIKKYGQIDALIHNACSSITYNSFIKTPWDNFQEQLDISIKAFYHLIQRALPTIKKQNFGRIITIATALALNVPTNKLSPYITAKSALIGMSKSLAVELAPYGITVNSISPGVTNTDFLNPFPSQMKEIMTSKIPVKRLADPKDIAGVISFLCSRNADYITGINIPVSGGMVM